MNYEGLCYPELVSLRRIPWGQKPSSLFFTVVRHLGPFARPPSVKSHTLNPILSYPFYPDLVRLALFNIHPSFFPNSLLLGFFQEGPSGCMVSKLISACVREATLSYYLSPSCMIFLGVNSVSSLSPFICLQAFLAEVVVSGLLAILVFRFGFSILY